MRQRSTGTTPDVFINRNFQALPLAPFPGVTTAKLSLPPGKYLMYVKFRYQGTGTSVQSASCVFQGKGVSGLDVSSNNNIVPTGDGQTDGTMMDWAQKSKGDDPDVHVQCWGPSDVKILNTQLVAVPATFHLQ